VKQQRAKRDGVFVAIAVLLFAGVMAWQTALIPSEAAYAQVGPAVMPWIVAALLAVLGAALLFQALTDRWQPDQADAPLHLRNLAWLAAGLIINLTTISILGFTLASTALFVCTARAFGSRTPLRDAAIGFVLALAAFVAFDRVLDYDIGSGLIEQLL
jgi:putative tricarboxylic transport membrane protein